MRSDIEAVVGYMYERYSEPISLADMAGVARLSQFHFSRTFLTATGVTPGRFLSAVRLDQAKTLLLSTTDTVTDISYRVGYNSVGTFTTRFTRSVGIPPVQYRRTSGQINGIPGLDRAASTTCPQMTIDSFGSRGGRWLGSPSAGAVDGRLSVPYGQQPIRVYVGIFDNAIAQGQLVAGAVLEGSTGFKLPSVPEGEWYALAVGAVGTPVSQWTRGPVTSAWMVAREGPVKVIGGQELELHLTMRKARPTDPPILLALPKLDGVKLLTPA